jgi:hypothetical protein
MPTCRVPTPSRLAGDGDHIYTFGLKKTAEYFRSSLQVFGRQRLEESFEFSIAVGTAVYAPLFWNPRQPRRKICGVELTFVSGYCFPKLAIPETYLSDPMEVFVLWKAGTQDSLAHSALEGDLDRSLGHYFYPSCILPTKQDVGNVDHLPAGHGVRIAYSLSTHSAFRSNAVRASSTLTAVQTMDESHSMDLWTRYWRGTAVDF